MIGDVTLHLDTPRTGWLRRIAEVSVDAPNLTHLHPGDTAQLAAVVVDGVTNRVTYWGTVPELN